MDLNSTLFFVAVANAGSFTEASRRLRVPKSTISDKVTELEKRLGVTLMMRTTRRLRLTEVGSTFLQKAETAISNLQIAEEEAAGSQHAPTGTLRISAPANSVSHVIMNACVEFRRRWPKVKIELDFSDRRVDLIGEGYDIAFRPGSLPDSNLLAKLVGHASRILVAAPAYFKSRSLPKHPRDLPNHACLTLITTSVETTWTLRSKEGRSARVNVTDSLSSNSLSALKELVRMGEGIALLPNSICKAELSQKVFVRVLSDWATAVTPVHLVYPARRLLSAKIKEMLPLLELSVREIYR